MGKNQIIEEYLFYLLTRKRQNHYYSLAHKRKTLINCVLLISLSFLMVNNASIKVIPFLLVCSPDKSRHLRMHILTYNLYKSRVNIQ